MEPFRRFARVAAYAFAGVTLYTLTVKLPGGGLRGDWAHTGLHAVTGAAAAYAGWAAATPRPARALTLALVAVYGVLAVVGWFVDGLLMGTALQIPLAPPDHVFHLLLASGAAVTAARARGTVVHSPSRLDAFG